MVGVLPSGQRMVWVDDISFPILFPEYHMHWTLSLKMVGIWSYPLYIELDWFWSLLLRVKSFYRKTSRYLKCEWIFLSLFLFNLYLKFLAAKTQQNKSPIKKKLLGGGLDECLSCQPRGTNLPYDSTHQILNYFKWFQFTMKWNSNI